MRNLDGLSDKIQRDGYVVVRGLLTEAEINRLRAIAEHHFERGGISVSSGVMQPNAAVEVPELGWVFYHEKILNAFRKALGQQDIMFTSHCDVHSHVMVDWHKDDGTGHTEGGYFGEPTYGVDECRVYKVGVYLQDHAWNTGGLWVRRGSHLTASTTKGHAQHLSTRKGDVVIFDVRLTHAGQRHVMPLPGLEIPVWASQAAMNRVNRLMGTYDAGKLFFKRVSDKVLGPKLSVFFTFGVPNDYTVEFSRSNMQRQLRQTHRVNYRVDPSLRLELEKREVTLAEDQFEF